MESRSRHLYKLLYITMYMVMLSGCHEPEDETSREALYRQINELRENGCTCGTEWMPPVNALTWNTALEDAALNHAADMFQNNYFDHVSPDGTSPISRAQNAGYSGDYVGEVIARNYNKVEDVVDAWKESESHCRALMDSLYNELGGARMHHYWVVDLGKSK